MGVEVDEIDGLVREVPPQDVEVVAMEEAVQIGSP
jgi:hypothetical protein